MIQIPPEELRAAIWQVRYFSQEWWGETPIRLHSREVGDDGAPRLHNDFIDYLEDGLGDKRRGGSRSRRVEVDSPRRRVTKAFRLLRRRAPKEFDVLYCMCVLDQVGRTLRQHEVDELLLEFEASVRRTTQRMNLRAAKRGDPEVTEDEIHILVVSGARKLLLWAG